MNILEGPAGQDVVSCHHAQDPDNSAFDTHSMIHMTLQGESDVQAACVLGSVAAAALTRQHHQRKFTRTRVALELDSLRIQPEPRNEKAEHGAHCCILIQQLTQRGQLLNCLYRQNTCSFGAHGDDGVLNDA